MTVGGSVLLALAGLVAGALNAVAGGGSLVSFPALLAIGIAPLPANVTNTVALWPGYIGGVVGYREEIRAARRRLIPLLVVSVVGAVAGSVLLLVTPGDAFKAVVPWLVLVGTALFAIGPIVSRRLAARPAHDSPVALLAVLLGAVYGGYFGAGLGVIILAVLGLAGGGDLQQLNGVKNALSLTINAVAVIAFLAFGPIVWWAVLIMAVASLAGGYLGSRLARRLPAVWLRGFVLVLGLTAGIVLLVRG